MVEEVCVHWAIHYMLRPIIPVYTATLFILCIHNFRIIENVYWGTPHQPTQKEPSLLSWKAVMLLKAFIPSGSVDRVCSPPPCSCPLSHFLNEQAIKFVFIKLNASVHEAFTRKIIHSPLLALGVVCHPTLMIGNLGCW